MKPLSQPKPVSQDILNRTMGRQAQKRQHAEAILRELAFVLKMTQQVREEIDAAKENETLVVA